MQYNLYDIFYEDEEYPKRAEFCNQMGYIINEIEPDSEGKRRFQIQNPTPLTEDELMDMLRAKRTRLLEAFDKWEKAVLRGREFDDTAVMNWYRDLLDLKEAALENVPERIKYYL